jgi:hypothetical protein
MIRIKIIPTVKFWVVNAAMLIVLIRKGILCPVFNLFLLTYNIKKLLQTENDIENKTNKIILVEEGKLIAPKAYNFKIVESITAIPVKTRIRISVPFSSNLLAGKFLIE